MIQTIKNAVAKITGSKPATKSTLTAPSPDDARLYRYWKNQIERGYKKQPKDMWQKAMDRYTNKSDQDDCRAFVNGFRLYFESSMSFLDQQDPTFRVTPETAFIGDVTSAKRAECDAMYLAKVWREQECQKKESQKLASALLKNIGWTFTAFDKKKWMPSLKYLPAKNVAFDPDCDGQIDNATWFCHYEDIALEDFKALHPDLSDEDIKAITRDSGSVLSDSEQRDIKGDEGEQYKTITLYHIYAKNSAAVRKPKDTGADEGETPDTKLADELQLNTPRRYMQLVKGIEKLIVDSDAWPFDLDHDEFPYTPLQFNLVPEDAYGFTDHMQMAHMDEVADELMSDLAENSAEAAIVNYMGSGSNPADPVEVEAWLNGHGKKYLPDMLDTMGNPKVKPVEKRPLNPQQITFYELFDKMRNVASGISELLQTDTAQTMKDVTAIAARIADANMQQRINRRLGGPRGYEKSIQEDALKMLEVAHQFVPRFSTVTTMQPETMPGPMGESIPTGNQIEVPMELPWEQAVQAIAQGGQLIKLGVDAIVGQELAEYWMDRSWPNIAFRLSTSVAVLPGSTRTVTQEQTAAVEKQIYLEVVSPLLQTFNRPDLALKWAEDISRKAGIDNVEKKLPTMSDVAQYQQNQMMQQQMMQQQQQMGQAGGKPLNTPDANGGELQSGM